MALLTKADLQQRVAELEAALAATPAPAAPAEERRDELCQVLWIQREIFTGQTPTGKTFTKVSAQKGQRQRDGSRTYGQAKNLVAYDNGNGPLATKLAELHAAGEFLLAITAFESTYHTQDGRRCSEWVITSLSPLERTAPVAEPEA